MGCSCGKGVIGDALAEGVVIVLFDFGVVVAFDYRASAAQMVRDVALFDEDPCCVPDEPSACEGRGFQDPAAIVQFVNHRSEIGVAFTRSRCLSQDFRAV